MSKMLKSSGAMGLATLTSRLLGMVREVLYADFMGAGLVAAAFKMAFMIPNIFRRLLGEGALTAAFIPIFKEKEKTEGDQQMWQAANAVICGLVVAASAIIVLVLAAISIVLAINAPSQLGLPRLTLLEQAKGAAGHFNPGFPNPDFLSPENELMLQLLRLMFPYMVLVCLTAIFMGMLNARGRFFLPAMGATVLNGILIVVVLFVAPRFGETLDTQIYALAVGVLVAGAAQTAYQLPALFREGFRFRWVTPWRHPTVPVVIGKMIPGMMGVAAFQLNVLITQGIAYTIDKRIYAWFDYSVRLMEFPQGLFGISLATYLLPTLSGLAAEKKYPQLRQTLGQGLSYLAFSNMIASALLVALAEPVVRLLFEHGKFSGYDTRNVAYSLGCLAPGLLAFSTVNVLARAFYALGDTQTPMKISSVCLGLNVVFTLGLIFPFAQGGMGIANTMSACFNVWLLGYALKRKMSRLDFSSLAPPLVRIFTSGLIAGECAWLIYFGWDLWLGHAGLLEKAGAVFVPAAVAGLIYGGLTLWLRVPQAGELWHLLLSKRN